MSTSVLFDTPGPRGRKITRVFNLVSILLILAFVAYILGVMHRQGQLEPEKWTSLFTAYAWEYYFLPGMVSTLKAALLSVVTSLVFGMGFGYMRLSTHRAVRGFAVVVVEFFRAVPVLIMMIFFWLFLGRFSVFSPQQLPFIAVVIGLTLYNGSVIAELLRSGVKQLPKGQGEAGLAIGLTPGRVLRTVLMPQAMMTMLPSLVSQFVVILKDTALGYIISYPELLASARRLGSGEGNVLQTLIMAAVLFVVINFALTTLATWLSGFLRSRSSSGIKKADGIPGEVDHANPATAVMFKIPKA